MWAGVLLWPRKSVQKPLSTRQQLRVGLPGVPFHLLLVAEAEEAGADAHRHPGADFVEEPLEGEETSHRDGEDELAEWVHGHPSPLRSWEEERGARSERRRKRKKVRIGNGSD